MNVTTDSYLFNSNEGPQLDINAPWDENAALNLIRYKLDVISKAGGIFRPVIQECKIKSLPGCAPNELVSNCFTAVADVRTYVFYGPGAKEEHGVIGINPGLMKVAVDKVNGVCFERVMGNDPADFHRALTENLRKDDIVTNIRKSEISNYIPSIVTTWEYRDPKCEDDNELDYHCIAAHRNEARIGSPYYFSEVNGAQGRVQYFCDEKDMITAQTKNNACIADIFFFPKRYAGQIIKMHIG